MIIEPIKQSDGNWMATTDSEYWGCITTSLTKEDASEIRTTNGDEGTIVPMITPIDDPSGANSKTHSKFYGFISDVSQEELINEINARGITIPT